MWDVLVSFLATPNPYPGAPGNPNQLRSELGYKPTAMDINYIGRWARSISYTDIKI